MASRPKGFGMTAELNAKVKARVVQYIIISISSVEWEQHTADDAVCIGTLNTLDINARSPVFSI